MFQQTLTQIGLTPEEADIYQSLLDNGPQTATDLAKTTKVKRTYVYTITQSLLKKGLVSQEKQGRTTIFSAQSPDKLLDLAETNKLQAEQARLSLENVLPTLKSTFAASETRPVVTYYEGPEGVMKANMQILEEKQTILAYLVIDKKIDQMMEKHWKNYYQRRLAENIHVRAITPDTPEGVLYQQKDQAENRITKLVPRGKFPFSIEKNICGNKVAFFSIQNNILMATVIENELIANSERAFFELAWLQAENFATNQV